MQGDDTAAETFLPFTIDDGYDQPAYVEGRRNVYGPLRLRFRPMLHDERDQIVDAIQASNAAKGSQLMAAAISSRLKSWDAKDKNGKPLDTKPATISSLRPSLLDRLWQIVSGRDGGDVDPEATTAERNRQADIELQAAIEGRSPTLVAAEGAEKN